MIIASAARPKRPGSPVKAREALREQVATLAVKGAEQIPAQRKSMLRHANLLSQLKIVSVSLPSSGLTMAELATWLTRGHFSISAKGDLK
jgi:hypothetical protein